MIEEIQEMMTEKQIKCIICGTDYSLSDCCCSKCTYPALSLSSNADKKAILAKYFRGDPDVNPEINVEIVGRGTPNEKARSAACTFGRRLAASNQLGYKNYYLSDHRCPICHHWTLIKGFNSAGLVTACYAHGSGDPIMLKNCKRNNGAGTGTDFQFQAKLLQNWQKHNGKEWQLITNDGMPMGESIPQNKLVAGDILLGYNDKGIYKHQMLYLGQGEIVDARSADNRKSQISIRTYKEVCESFHITRAFRYLGNGQFK